jgi:hypothetical protein
MLVPSAGTETEGGKSGGGLSQSSDRPELVGDKQRDRVPELLSAQLDLAAVIVYERDSAVLGPSRLTTISGTQ